jgi:glutaconate CoA-transferase, subunit B
MHSPKRVAAMLARMVHNPESVLVYESGAIGAKPHHVPLSIGDGELAETADFIVSEPEMFNYWIGAGRIGVAVRGRRTGRLVCEPELDRDR